MMTPTRIVRFLGFVGLAAFLGLVASSKSTIQAQISDDRPAPPPPPIATEAPAPKPVVTSEPVDLPAEPAPIPEPADDKPTPTPLPTPTPTPEISPIAENPEAAPIPRAPEPVGLDAAPTTAPQPIAESGFDARPGVVDDVDPLPPVAAAAPASTANDPEKQAQSFVERNRKEAEAQLKALNAEAAQLRARLSKVESGIRRWQALADAMDRTEESTSLYELDPLPRAARPSSNRRPASAAVIRSTPEDDPVTRAQFVPAPLPR